MASSVLKLAYSEGGVSVPSEFARNDYIMVFADGKATSDFTIENDGKGGRVLILKDGAADVCMVYRPEIGLSLGKFNASVLTDIMDWAERVEARVEAAQQQVDGAFLGGPCDALPEGDCLVPVISDGVVTWLEAADWLAKIMPPAAHVEPEPAPEPVEDLPVWDIKLSKRITFADWECVEYCRADWPVEFERCDWPVEWPDCSKERVTGPTWFKDMKPVCWVGYVSPDRSWECGSILFPKKYTIRPASWS